MVADVLPTAPTHEIKYFILWIFQLFNGFFFHICEIKAIYILKIY